MLNNSRFRWLWIGSLVCWFSILQSCASATKETELSDALSLHSQLIQQQAKQAEGYSGLANVYNVQTVLLNSQINLARHNLDIKLTRKSEDESLMLLQKLKVKEARETEVFLSFFSPDRRQNRLDRPNSPWKFFLKVDQTRYPAAVKAVRGHANEVQGFYPIHTRWSLPYTLVFDVPLSQVESSKATLEMVTTMESREVSIELN